MPYLIFIFVAIFSYLFGSIPVSYIVAKLWGKNVHEVGSGNVGTANVYRATGKGFPTLLALLGDMAKGIFALKTALAFKCLGPQNLILAEAIAAFFVVAGHNWPIFLKFRGGKGLATLAGLILYLNWKLIFIVLAIIIFFIFLTEIIMRKGIKLEGSFKEKIKKLFAVFISQILGRVLGIVASAFVVYFFYPRIFKILLGAAILSGIRHVKRTKDFVKTKHAI